MTDATPNTDDNTAAIVVSTVNNNDTNTVSLACLHCHTIATFDTTTQHLDNHDSDPKTTTHSNSNHIQVSCDDCHAYICQNCHWCHEYQGNHEIRVCDRCDSFYCRQCDEMDVCSDCLEVVCGSCTTLMSCKFCGVGLCEDCAVCCGRCGIVLCKRDSKFAVECDTCKLAYCLVCLAHGSSSSSAPSARACVRCHARPSKRVEQLVHLRLKSIYKAFKSSGSSGGSGSGSVNTININGVVQHHQQQQSNHNNNMNNDNHNNNNAHHPNLRIHPKHRNTNQQHRINNRNTMTSCHPCSDGNDHHPSNDIHNNNSDDDDDDDDTDENNQCAADHFAEEVAKADEAYKQLLAELEAEEDTHHHDSNNNDADDDDADDADDDALALEDDIDNGSLCTHSNHSLSSSSSSSSSSSTSTTSTQREAQLLHTYITCGDVPGIESILENTRGVPGKAQLRKNAKKALKKLQQQQQSVTANALPQDVASSVLSSTAKQANTNVTVEDSIEHSIRVLIPTPSTLLQYNALNTLNGNSGGDMIKVKLKLNPLVVGWVIGKRGMKIKDLMHVSGTKVWIDQVTTHEASSTGDDDLLDMKSYRFVYLQGDTPQVRTAIALLVELIATSPSNLLSAEDRAAKAAARKDVNINVETAAVVGVGTHVGVDVSTAVAPTNINSNAVTTGGAVNKKSIMSNHNLNNVTTSVTVTGSNSKPNNSRTVLPCPPQFVPLLIGKRGWTIQHIQEVSGARVDIDQTAYRASLNNDSSGEVKVVDPSVVMSGSAKSVDQAKRMVEDVLRYPYANIDHGANTSDSHQSNNNSNSVDSQSQSHKGGNSKLQSKQEDDIMTEEPGTTSSAVAMNDINLNHPKATAKEETLAQSLEALHTGSIVLPNQQLQQQQQSVMVEEDTEEFLLPPHKELETLMLDDEVSDVTGASCYASVNITTNSNSYSNINTVHQQQGISPSNNNVHHHHHHHHHSALLEQQQQQHNNPMMASYPDTNDAASSFPINSNELSNTNTSSYGAVGSGSLLHHPAAAGSGAVAQQQQQHYSHNPPWQPHIGLQHVWNSSSANTMLHNSQHNVHAHHPGTVSVNASNPMQSNILLSAPTPQHHAHLPHPVQHHPQSAWSVWGAAANPIPNSNISINMNSSSVNTNAASASSSSSNNHTGGVVANSNIKNDKDTSEEDLSLEHFLNHLNLSKYKSILQQNEIDLAVLPLMSEHDLAELGLPKGPRLKILNGLMDWYHTTQQQH